MTDCTLPHHSRPAYLAALDLSSDDIVRPELCNAAILAGKHHRAKRDDSRSRRH
ncbi:MAG: hypothetical protein L0I84_08835 [Halomonas subglaciescola]|nr:hypothetical protein [Halomonas subglaciescola]